MFEKMVLDYDTNKLLQTFSDGTAIDSDGNVYMRVDDYHCIDLRTNKLHNTPEWTKDKDNP